MREFPSLTFGQLTSTARFAFLARDVLAEEQAVRRSAYEEAMRDHEAETFHNSAQARLAPHMGAF